MLLFTLLGCYPELPIVDDPCASWEKPGTYRFTSEHEGKKRRALVYVPATEGPREMIVALHGGGDSGVDFGTESHLYQLAREEEIVLSAPNGLGLVHHWNAGDCCGPSRRKGVDDLGYLEQLARDLQERVCVDAVYAFGHSNGGMMAHRWACESDTVEALVVAAGPLEADSCGQPGDTPVPVRHYHGTLDPVIPYDGSPTESGRSYNTAEDTIALWRERNVCSADEPLEAAENAASCRSWTCEASTVLCLVEGHGHHWPGSRPESGVDEPDATRNGWAWIQEVTGRGEARP